MHPEELGPGSKRTNGLTVTLYWTGAVASITCVALVFASNTELLWRQEHAGFPWSWRCGLMAIGAFLAAEICGSCRLSRGTAELLTEAIQAEV